MTTSLEDVRSFIRFATKDQLDTIGDITRSRWKHLQAELSFDFKAGDYVSWVRGKRDPRRERGTVIASDGKWVYIQMYAPPTGNPQKWDVKCAPSLLTKVSSVPGPNG
jgi:hypothetical protein